MQLRVCLATVFARVALLALSAPTSQPRAIPTDGTVPASVTQDSALLTPGVVSAIGAAEVESYTPYGWFAQVTYCPQPRQADWSCASCQANPVKDFQLYASGGDGGIVQNWYVGWWPSRQSIVVAHEGTEFNNTFAVLTDAALLPVQLNPKLFPGIPFQATAHLGFKAAHERTADIVLKTVKQIIDEKGATKVVTVGHSLGGALALLDGLYLRLNLPSKVNVITRTFGQPRVGNDAFSIFVDQKLPDLVRITNKHDPVPVVPPVTLGYRHTSGEKHINAQSAWNACAGRDNLNENCSTGQILRQAIVLDDHLGPYGGGVMLGAGSCV